MPEGPLKNSTAVAFLPKLNENWFLSMEIKPLGVVSSKFSNVIHISFGYDKTLDLSKRFPAVFFRKGSTKLKVCKTATVNTCYESNKPLPLNQYTRVTISNLFMTTTKYAFKIKVNGTVVQTFTKAKKAVVRYNGTVYASDRWNPAAKAQIRNFYLKNLFKGMFRIEYFFFLVKKCCYFLNFVDFVNFITQSLEITSIKYVRNEQFLTLLARIWDKDRTNSAKYHY